MEVRYLVNHTGTMNARIVIEKAPVRLRKLSNFGTYIDNTPVSTTIKVLCMILFSCIEHYCYQFTVGNRELLGSFM